VSSPQAPARGGGYQRSASGLLGAMVATVLAVVAFVAFRGLTRDNEATAVPTVDWHISYQAARADNKLQVLAPTGSLPSGWKATSVSYMPGGEPAWHLGLLTGSGKYVGIDESTDDLDGLVHQNVDPDASRGRDVTITGQKWQVYTDARGDYALGRTLRSGNGQPYESQLVGGSAPDATIRAFVATLPAPPVARG
jgi:Protein of unknown function (DUF4245)